MCFNREGVSAAIDHNDFIRVDLLFTHQLEQPGKSQRCSWLNGKTFQMRDFLQRIKSLVINFCGAFARTDVMTQGVIEAIEALQPKLPIFFSVHGTGDEEAIKLLKDRLGVTPLATMDDAIKAAIKATIGAAAGAAR